MTLSERDALIRECFAENRERLLEIALALAALTASMDIRKETK